MTELIEAANRLRKAGVGGAARPEDVDLVTGHVLEAAAEQAATIAKQSARIAQLEAMGPLIEEYGVAKWSAGYESPTSEKGSSDAWVADLWGRITAILKGGA